MANSTTEVALPVSEVLLKHGYKLLYPTVEHHDVTIYYCSRADNIGNNKRLFKVEEYAHTKQCPASLNYQCLNHKNLLPYVDHFNEGDHAFYLSDITRPSAPRFLEMICLDVQHQEQLVQKWTKQIVDVLIYCHTASLYLTDFNWEDTVIDISNSNLLLTAFDGMTDLMINKELKLGAQWKLPPEVAHFNESQLLLRIEMLEAWTLGFAILDLLARQHISMPIEQWWHHFEGNLDFLSSLFEILNLSQDAQSFVSCLLQPDSSKRYNVHHIREHSWLVENNASKYIYFDFGSKQLRTEYKETDQCIKVSTIDQDKVTLAPMSVKPSVHCKSLNNKTQTISLSSSSPIHDGKTKSPKSRPERTHSNEICCNSHPTLGQVIKILPDNIIEGDRTEKVSNVIWQEKCKGLKAKSDCPDVLKATDMDNIQKITIVLQQDILQGPGSGTNHPNVLKASNNNSHLTRDGKVQNLSHCVGDMTHQEYEGCTESDEALDIQANKTPTTIIAWTFGISLVTLLILWESFNHLDYDL